MKDYDIEYGDTFMKRFKGLMLRRNIPDNYIFVLYPCKQVHGMFMLRDISLIVLNKEKVVIDKVEILKPWSISKHYSDGYYILELIDRKIYEAISIGDKVEI